MKKKILMFTTLLLSFVCLFHSVNAYTLESNNGYDVKTSDLVLSSSNGQMYGAYKYSLLAVKGEETDYMDSNCESFAKTIRIGGFLIFVLKIVLPLYLIIRTSIDLVSVVTSGDPGELKKKANKLLVSFVSAALIFFTPTIVNIIFGIVTDVKGVEKSTNDMNICRACLFEPFSGECDKHIKD